MKRHSFYDVQLAKLGMEAIKLMAEMMTVSKFSLVLGLTIKQCMFYKYSVTNEIFAYMEAAILAIECLCNSPRRNNEDIDYCHREMLAMGDGLDVVTAMLDVFKRDENDANWDNVSASTL